MGAETIEQARAAKAELRTELSGRHDVRGIGIRRGPDGFELQVNLVAEPAPTSAAGAPSAVPTSVRGIGVHVQVVGQVRAS